MSSSPSHTGPFLLQAHQLRGGWHGQPAFNVLNTGWPAGLNWVCGDEGCGKTTLLRTLAGEIPPLQGHVTRSDPSVGFVFWADLQAETHDQTTVQACWDRLSPQFPPWNSERLEDLCEALDMQKHREKPLFMLSTGSRRKVSLIAALASGAMVTLLDQPFAALDLASVQVMKDFLREAAEHPTRAWIVADHEPPSDLPAKHRLNLQAANSM